MKVFQLKENGCQPVDSLPEPVAVDGMGLVG